MAAVYSERSVAVFCQVLGGEVRYDRPDDRPAIWGFHGQQMVCRVDTDT